jgi:adenylate cyclase
MNKYEKNRLSDKFIRFSIGAKLVSIITILIIISLGTIIFLVSNMVRQDLKDSADENNYEINRRSAAETEYTLANICSNSQVLIQVISSAGGINSVISEKAAAFFFEENKQIAAIVFQTPEITENFLINEDFFDLKNIDSSKVNSYYRYRENIEYYQKAQAGESTFLNAYPHFSMHLLALFFQTKDRQAVSILFSPENLKDSYSFEINQSYLINNNGDILLHPDSNMVRNVQNISDKEYISRIRKSVMSEEQYSLEEDGIMYNIAYSKLKIGASIVITSIEYSKIFDVIDTTTRRNLLLSAAVVFLSVLFIWFFSKTISTALKILANAAQKIEGGDFNLDLKPKSRDEIGFLTIAFQRMSSALSVFGRFTNREIAVKAMRGEIKPGGLPKHGTVFFSDIRGFTEKSEVFTNEFGKGASDKIVFWLNEYFTQMVECVEKTNGVVDKFIGDAVMAHWGTAYTAGNPAKDAFNCVKAALMMRKALVMLNRKRIPGDPGDPPINIGCGINSGIVTAGQLGSELRMEYTVIGDPVNLASRIEALNKPLGTDILISESTWKLIKYFFITEEMPSVTVKGKEKPVRIFAVVNHVSVTSGPRTLAEVRELLGIKPPDVSKVDVNAEEKKYKIGGGS